MSGNKLTPTRVREIFEDCLFKDNSEVTDDAVVVDGIIAKYGFHPARLESHRADVAELLAQLPEQFHAETGGGWSFLNGCQDKDGNLWTGDQMMVENLFVLGEALKMVVCLMPREMWPALPGGMPYYMVLAPEATEVKEGA